MLQTIANILKIQDLRNRILFTFAMLAVYRLGVFVPAPGVNRKALADFFSNQSNSLFGIYDMFSGGALEQFSVFVLGIMPYITASIVMQVARIGVPQLERLSKEGQAGINKINQYTRYLTIGIALVQSFAISVGLENMRSAAGAEDIVINAGWGFRLMTMLTMTAGSCFVMWLGEQITERGIGNGSSLIITAGIIVRFPAAAANTFQKVTIGDINLLGLSLLLLFMLGVIGAIVFVERGQRRVPIQYARRVVGRKVYGGQNTHLPLKVNTGGVMPPIFASALLTFPSTLAGLTSVESQALDLLIAAFYPGNWLYNAAYVALIVFFSYFYMAISFNPVDVADNLKKQGGFIPGIRPGKQTAQYIDYVLTRLSAGGAAYLSVVCIIPTLLISQYNVPFYFGGTGLLIVVGVSLDTVAQIESQLLTLHYEGDAVAGGGGRRRHRRMLERGGDNTPPVGP